jgi:hypothetical protein
MDTMVNINDLFAHACKDGAISTSSAQVLNVPDIGRQIADALGTASHHAPASEMILVTLLVDDSGSIRFAGNMNLIMEGHNHVVDALARTQQSQNIMIHTRYLNGHILYPYSAVSKALKMDRKNYNPSLGTPLYDQAVIVLGTVLAKTQYYADNGIPTRTVTLMLTDGVDVHSMRATEHTVAALVRDMLRTENHIIAAMGVQDGSRTDFRTVFRNMGIDDQWIMTPGKSHQEIRQAFHLFSRSCVRVSQPGASHSLLSLGGFAA